MTPVFFPEPTRPDPPGQSPAWLNVLAGVSNRVDLLLWAFAVLNVQP